MNNKELIDQVMAQILTDIDNGDLSFILKLLENVSNEALIAYLPENE